MGKMHGHADNIVYDLVSIQYHALKGGQVYEQYKNDAEGHDGMAAGAVQAIGRKLAGQFRHVRTPWVCQDGNYRLAPRFWAALPDAGRYAKSCVRRNLR